MWYALVFGSALASSTLSLHAPRLARGCGLLLAIVLLLFAGLRADSTDYGGYVDMFDFMGAADFLDWPVRILIGKDPLFGALILALVQLNANVQWLFFICAALSVGLKWAAFNRVLGSAAVPLLLSLFGYYFLHDFTQIRAAVAIGFCFLSLIKLQEGQRATGLVLGLVGTGFHASAILYVIFGLVTTLPARRARWTLAGLVLLILLTARVFFGLLAQFDDRTAMQLEQTGTSLTPVLVAAIRLGVLLWLYRKLRDRWPERAAFLHACMLLSAAAWPMLVGTRDLSSAAGFRLYELLDSFSIFILAAAFMRGSWMMRLCVIGLSAVSLFALLRDGVLPSYAIAGL